MADSPGDPRSSPGHHRDSIREHRDRVLRLSRINADDGPDAVREALVAEFGHAIPPDLKAQWFNAEPHRHWVNDPESHIRALEWLQHGLEVTEQQKRAAKRQAPPPFPRLDPTTHLWAKSVESWFGSHLAVDAWAVNEVTNALDVMGSGTLERPYFGFIPWPVGRARRKEAEEVVLAFLPRVTDEAINATWPTDPSPPPCENRINPRFAARLALRWEARERRENAGHKQQMWRDRLECSGLHGAKADAPPQAMKKGRGAPKAALLRNAEPLRRVLAIMAADPSLSLGVAVQVVAGAGTKNKSKRQTLRELYSGLFPD